MKQFFIKKQVKTDQGFVLTEKVKEQLMTPEVLIAMQAGCKFDVTMKDDGNGFLTISLRSREKISMLKAPDGTVLDVIIRK